MRLLSSRGCCTLSRLGPGTCRQVCGMGTACGFTQCVAYSLQAHDCVALRMHTRHSSDESVIHWVTSRFEAGTVPASQAVRGKKAKLASAGLQELPLPRQIACYCHVLLSDSHIVPLATPRQQACHCNKRRHSGEQGALRGLTLCFSKTKGESPEDKLALLANKSRRM
jgi:hypothetical protein